MNLTPMRRCCVLALMALDVVCLGATAWCMLQSWLVGDWQQHFTWLSRALIVAAGAFLLMKVARRVAGMD